jgi:hypothetical protein
MVPISACEHVWGPLGSTIPGQSLWRRTGGNAKRIEGPPLVTVMLMVKAGEGWGHGI